MVWLGIAALLLGVYGHMEVVQERSLNISSEMAGVDDLINRYLAGFADAALTATAIGVGLGWTAWRQWHWGFAAVLLGFTVPLAASVGLIAHYSLISYRYANLAFEE
jgi:hypothetical protein